MTSTALRKAVTGQTIRTRYNPETKRTEGYIRPGKIVHLTDGARYSRTGRNDRALCGTSVRPAEDTAGADLEVGQLCPRCERALEALTPAVATELTHEHERASAALEALEQAATENGWQVEHLAGDSHVVRSIVLELPSRPELRIHALQLDVSPYFRARLLVARREHCVFAHHRDVTPILADPARISTEENAMPAPAVKRTKVDDATLSKLVKAERDARPDAKAQKILDSIREKGHAASLSRVEALMGQPQTAPEPKGGRKFGGADPALEAGERAAHLPADGSRDHDLTGTGERPSEQAMRLVAEREAEAAKVKPAPAKKVAKKATKQVTPIPKARAAKPEPTLATGTAGA